MTSNDEALGIRIETHRPPDDSLAMHITESDADEVFGNLREAGLDVQGPLIELSIPETVEIAMAVGGPSSAILAALRTYLHRNDNKSAKVQVNGVEIDLRGYSPAEAETFFENRKREWDDAWRKQMDEPHESNDPAD